MRRKNFHRTPYAGITRIRFIEYNLSPGLTRNTPLLNIGYKYRFDLREFLFANKKFQKCSACIFANAFWAHGFAVDK